MNYLKIFLSVILMTSLSVLFFAGCSDSEGKKENQLKAETKKADLYYCPMHPEVTSDKPGSCPICHMDLVKKADEGEESASQNEMEGMVSLSSRRLALANVATTVVKEEEVSRQISAFGYMDFAEPLRRQITAWFNGRIEKLFVDATGDYVKKGQALFEIYSPDLVQAQNEYLIALRSSNSSQYAFLNNNMEKSKNDLLVSVKKKLEILGMTDKQISELEKTQDIKLTLVYHSPYSGTVIEKKVQEGMYVNEGSIIYDIADLSTLWNISEIYADDLGMVKVGDKINLKIQAYPGEEFTGKVTFIYPVINPESRTVKIRSEFRNMQNKLKPQMYTEAVFAKSFGDGLVVPEEAVLLTGKRNIVWVKAEDKMFEPREVKLGLKYDGKYQILSGLNEGEEVVSSGGYLIDSESQLKSGMPSGHQHGSTPRNSEDNNESGQQENNTEQNIDHSNH